MDYQEANYLMHYGVPGMRWGHRKRQDRVSTSRADRKINRIDNRIERNNAKIAKLKGKKHGTARYEDMKNLRQANKINNAKKNKIRAKESFKEAKGTSGERKAKTELKRSKTKLRAEKLHRRNSARGTYAVAQLGYGKSARGSYYRSREMGRGRVNSALRATGKQTMINLAAGAGTAAAIAGGKAAVKYYLNKKTGSNLNVGALPAYEVIQAKNVKVRTVRR